MDIAVKSEIDSRVLVYPLIKVLSLYGSVAVFTNNKSFTRLIENELEGGFKNIRVIVSLDADLEAMLDSDEFFKGKYDFCIFDNVGYTEYDIMLVPIANHLSEDFMNDLVYAVTDNKTKVIKFGSPAPAIKKEKGSKPEKKKKGAVEEEVDDNFNKWKNEKSDEEILQEILMDKELKWCKFPSFDAIENMESRGLMLTPDDSLIKELYKIFGFYVSVDLHQFTKGARLNDKSGVNINGTDIR